MASSRNSIDEAIITLRLDIEHIITYLFAIEGHSEKSKPVTSEVLGGTWFLKLMQNDPSEMGSLKIFLCRGMDRRKTNEITVTYSLDLVSDEKVIKTELHHNVVFSQASIHENSSLTNTEIMEDYFRSHAAEEQKNRPLTLVCKIYKPDLDKKRITKAVQDENYEFSSLEDGKLEDNIQQLLSPLSLQNDLKAMLTSRIQSDIKFQTNDGKIIHSHRCILSARSPVFASMLGVDMKESISGTIVVPDMNGEELGLLLNYMYTDIVENLDFEKECKLLVLSDFYDMTALKAKLSVRLKTKISKETVCEIVRISSKINVPELRMTGIDFIENNKEVINSPSWVELLEKDPDLAEEILMEINVVKYEQKNNDDDSM